LTLDRTHNPDAETWVDGANTHPDFPVQNLPLGVFSVDGGTPRIGIAIGDYVLDLAALASSGLLPSQAKEALNAQTLNALFSTTSATRKGIRHAVFDMLTNSSKRALAEPNLHDRETVTMHLPTQIGDYTDFYVGIHHATNIGKLFRPDNPLLPNYKHVPIGYHGRASSVRLSGTNVIRPNGQRLEPGAEAPTFGPCRRLDYELELGIWIAGNNELGEPVPISKAKDRIAGFTLLNDWSARDIQAWEYQPLGPFLAKNFVTSVSPWIITAEAMAPFFRAQPERPGGDPKPLPYLWDEDDQTKGALALDLTVSISTAKMRDAGLLPHKLSHGQASNMYWTAAQMIAHHTSGGCNLQAGDLLGSGTISSAEPGGFGSLMEISSGGTEPVQLPGGETRSFLEDGDDIIMSAHAVAEGARAIGFGECTGRIVPRYGG
jgi:fumarylacetoacetase